MATAAGLHERNDFGQEFGKNSDLSQMSLQQAAAAAAAWQKSQGGNKTGVQNAAGVAAPWGSGSASSGWGGSNTGGSDRWGQVAGAGQSSGQWESSGTGANGMSNLQERDLSWNPSTAYFQQQTGEGSSRGARKQGWNAGNW